MKSKTYYLLLLSMAFMLCAGTLTAAVQSGFLQTKARAQSQYDQSEPFGFCTVSSRTDASSTYDMTGGGCYTYPIPDDFSGKVITLTSNGEDMKGDIQNAIKKNDVVILDGSNGDFIVSSNVGITASNKTIIGINKARICTQWSVTDELKAALDNAGVPNMSTSSGTGGTLTNGTKVSEQAEYNTRQIIINLTGDSEEKYRESGCISLINCQNIIIRNLIFQGPGSIDVSGNDLISSTGAKNVWVDHCTFQDGMDGNFDITNSADFHTVSWCIFRYTDRSYMHQNTNLIGSSDSETTGYLNTTFAYNWWGDGCKQRMPMARVGKIHMLNNYFSSTTASNCINPRKNSEFLIEGNNFASGVGHYYGANDPTAVTWTDNNYIAEASSLPDNIGSTVTVPYDYTVTDYANIPTEVQTNAGATLEFEATVEEPEEDVTATWDWQNQIPASITSTNIQGTDATGTVASDVDGISLNVLAAVKGTYIKLQYNASGYAQFNSNTCIQVPVKNANDEVTVVSYPGQSNYTVGGEDATGQNTFTHTATKTEAAAGYVEIVATSTAYLYSIKVVQKVPSNEPVLVEKSIYKTDFSDWDLAKATAPATEVSKQTKFSNETLTFSLYQTSVMATEDSKFASYTTLPKMTLRAEKNSGSNIITSALAEITKIRFIHGATGSNRGWKVEAKGDGDEDWVVVSSSPAYPQNWCEVTADVNKKNVQLRFTNLADNQNAFLFELEIFANVDMSNAPILGSFKANGNTYVGDDFEMGSTDYEATFELFSTDKMISAENRITDVTADNGEIGTITYEGDDSQCVVTIPVTAKGETVNYIATFVRKPYYTLTYLDTTGAEIGTQQVEKDTKIGTFTYDIADVAATKNGYKARGWFKQNHVGEKFATESVITEDASLYAIETEIEVASTSRKYEFDLRSQTFYAEDHEAFNPTGNGKWHDTTHGWVFSNGDKIGILVGPKAVVSFTICQYSKSDAKITCGDTELAAYSTTDGDVVSYTHDGEAGELEFVIESAGAVYLHNVKIMNTAELNFDVDGEWYFVKQGDASSLVDAIDYVNGLNSTADASRKFIFLPNGTYDLEAKALTQISGHNISIIGESMEGVIIKNRPVKEGIAITATLLNTGTNNYLQDLTLDCIAPYGTGDDTKSAERGVCLQDKGNQTICKNVYLKGLQDTYYSNNSNGTFYFEGGKIEGTVDYVCGNGDVYFNDILFYNTNRSTGGGNDVIAAPNTPKSWGYIFNDCTINGTDANKNKYRLGRPWAASGSSVRMLNTKMLILPVAEGWSEWDTHTVVQYGEYNSVDANGNAVDLTSRRTTFGASTSNPVITAEEAANYIPTAIFSGNWKPYELAAQAEAPEANCTNGVISGLESGQVYLLTNSTNGSWWIINNNDGTFALADASELVYTTGDQLTIRTANDMGGFGEAKVVSGTATGIHATQAAIERGEQVVYNLAGQRINKATRGLYIGNGKKMIKK